MSNKVYVLVNYGNWDGSFMDVEVFDTREKATIAYLDAVAGCKETLEANYDNSELTFDSNVERLYFEAYMTEWYDDYHQIILVKELYVK